MGYLNAQDNNLAKVLTSVDAPQRLILSGSYDLPFLQNTKSFLGVFGGWKMNWIVSLQSGLPIGTPSGAYSSGIDPRIADDQRTRSHWFNPCTLSLTGVRQNCATASEPVAFLVQPPFTLRTLSGRFPNIRTSRPVQIDFSIFRTFTLHENMKFQVRAEAFNLANTPWFGAPNTTLGGSALQKQKCSWLTE